MNDITDILRAATAEGATDEQKKAAATVCRNLAAALDAQPGQSLGPQPPPSPLAMLAQLDVDQVLDLVIAKLRAKLGANAPATTPSGFRPPMLKMPIAGGQ